jgi:pilus assembly protein CpaE
LKVVSLLSAKGGSGASLVATNLGVLMARKETSLLVDLHPGMGYDDLLLDVTHENSWQDLLPVADELTPRHLELTLTTHSSGLKLLCAPDIWLENIQRDRMLSLLRALAKQTSWLFVDVPAGLDELTRIALDITDVVLLVALGDPPALRAAKRLLEALPEQLIDKTGLVLNQVDHRHPVKPRQVAAALGVPLLAALPPDSRAVGYQVNFGRPCVLDDHSRLGRAIAGLGKRLSAAAAQQVHRT